MQKKKNRLLWYGGIIITLILLTSCAGQSPEIPNNWQSFTSQLDSTIPQLMQRYHVPGAAVALVHDGEMVWTKGYGQANLATQTPVTSETVFQAASISKTLTAWGVMRLVEQGKIDLDAPAERYLTRWQLPSSEYDSSQVTIRRLLSHSAGLSVGGYPGISPELPLPSLEESLSGNYDGARPVKIVREPGTAYQYSGGGYTLLQLVIEEVSGESFSTFMQREVLDALGMSHSSFEWRDDLRPATATGYNEKGQPEPNFLFTEKAAAGLYTTAPDLARFALAEMDANNGILSPESIGLMHSAVIPVDGITSLFGNAYGLGHTVDSLPAGWVTVGHSGGNQGWKLQYQAIPEKKAAIVILTNSDNGSNINADLLGIWTEWVGAGKIKVAQTHDTLRLVTGLLAGLLGLGLLAKLVVFFRQIAHKQRVWFWTLPKKSAGTIVRFIGFILTAILLAAAWLAAFQPILSGFAPVQTPWLMIVTLGWCVSILLSALTSKPK